MAVASYLVNGRQVAMRGFHPPARATVTHWYRAATVQIDAAPDWRTVNMASTYVDENCLIYEGEDWKLVVNRKRFLK